MARRRRIVRITPGFQADLDRQLPPERTPAGAPSRLDFLLYELPDIMEAFAADFDVLPGIVGAPAGARCLAGHGQMVDLYYVAGRLADHEVVELELLEVRLPGASATAG